jgi:AraC-like DNA-binding protein
MDNKSTYKEIKPCSELKQFVHSFWMHQNNTDVLNKITIVPDSYFKIVITLKKNKVISYFMTGLWTEEKIVPIPANATSIGCRLKILAPEFLLEREVAFIINGFHQLEHNYLNIDTFDFSNFESIVEQWQNQLILKIKERTIPGNKLRLSQVLDKTNGEISATEVSNQIYWTNRQINRYLNKYLGVSLKKYLNIQKCYNAYFHIRDGKFFPENGYFDQPHFIREIKKHTGETPSSLHQKQNDHFIQLKRISKK